MGNRKIKYGFFPERSTLSPGGDGTESITVFDASSSEKGAVRNPAASLASGKETARPVLEPELNKWEL